MLTPAGHSGFLSSPRNACVSRAGHPSPGCGRSRADTAAPKKGVSVCSVAGPLRYTPKGRPKSTDGDKTRCGLSYRPACRAIWEDFEQASMFSSMEFYGARGKGSPSSRSASAPVAASATLSRRRATGSSTKRPRSSRGEPGELSSSPLTVRAFKSNYFGKPAKPRDKKTAGGWLHMGERSPGRRDGWLFFHYRKGGGIRLQRRRHQKPRPLSRGHAECPEVDDVTAMDVPRHAPWVRAERDPVAAVLNKDHRTFDLSRSSRPAAGGSTSNFVPRSSRVWRRSEGGDGVGEARSTPDRRLRDQTPESSPNCALVAEIPIRQLTQPRRMIP